MSNKVSLRQEISLILEHELTDLEEILRKSKIILGTHKVYIKDQNRFIIINGNTYKIKSVQKFDNFTTTPCGHGKTSGILITTTYPTVVIFQCQTCMGIIREHKSYHKFLNYYL